MLASTFFLVGPLRQLKNMTQPTRLIASIVFLGSMALTLYAVFGIGSGILAFFCVVIQFLALGWYVLSYIPFARSCVKNTITGAVSV